jgi:ketosteroid isomerase-like protein
VNDPPKLLTRMLDAMNQHDLEAFLACFAERYRGDGPGGGNGIVRSRDDLRSEWEESLREGSDFHADLVGWAAEGDEIWAEWRWRGTRPDGTRRRERGVAIYRVEDEVLVAGRLYLMDEDGA